MSLTRTLSGTTHCRPLHRGAREGESLYTASLATWQRRVAMEVLYPRCCGLDVHKSSIAACVLLREQGRIRTERRRFPTMTQDLETLGTWLRPLQVKHVAIESTGVYWKQVWNILDGHFTNILANAQHV